MEIEPRGPSWSLFIVASVASVAAGFGAGYVVRQNETKDIEVRAASPTQRFVEDFIRWDPNNRIAQDAARRWAEKTHQTVAEVRNEYVPVSVSTGTRDCVQLIFPDYSLGGTPTYCYRAGTLELVEEHSDVE